MGWTEALILAALAGIGMLLDGVIRPMLAKRTYRRTVAQLTLRAPGNTVL